MTQAADLVLVNGRITTLAPAVGEARALAIRDVLVAFGVEGVPDQAALDKLVSSEIAELARLQHQDGGFGFWGTDGESQGYVSVHVSHALARAAAAKREVPGAMATSLRSYVKGLPDPGLDDGSARRRPRPAHGHG